MDDLRFCLSELDVLIFVECRAHLKNGGYD